MLKTFQYRIKDSCSRRILNEIKNSVNIVWNYCNQIQKESLRKHRGFLSNYDFNALTSGTSKDLGLHSQTIQAICDEYYTKVKQFRKPFLRWRGRRSLGWIPFKKTGIRIKDFKIIYCGKSFRMWKSREIPENIKCGSFSQDARGRWYINIVCDVCEEEVQLNKEIGVDLGLKNFAVLSNGEKFSPPRWYRRLESSIAFSQRKRNKKRTQSIHAKAKNQRKDWLHKLSTNLSNSNKLIIVGNVSSSKLAKTKMAKSVLDAGWSMFRAFLKYKSIARGGVYREVSEHLTTQTCSHCLTVSGPKGREGLGVREWVCKNCNTLHDRDVNSAVNILRLGHQSLLAEGQ